jgi:hypothetical protein
MTVDQPVQNLMRILAEQISLNETTTTRRKYFLCTPEVNLYTTDSQDRSYGCGYRNLQMLWSSIANSPDFPSNHPKHLGSIQDIQRRIEEAWRDGFDPDGAAQLQHKLVQTRKWIGTTEIAMVLYYYGIQCKIIDFWKESRVAIHDHKHVIMIEWIREYFLGFKTDHDALMACPVIQTSLPPLYFQFQGHSQTIVGIVLSEDLKLVESLLLFDPYWEQRTIERAVYAGKLEEVMTLPLLKINKDQYQIVSLLASTPLKVPPYYPSIWVDTSTQTKLNRKRGAYEYERYP